MELTLPSRRTKAIDAVVGATLDSLPEELLVHNISSFLVGLDLLQLIQTNRRVHGELLAHPELWTQRMLESHTSDVHHALVNPKTRYLQDTSLCFRGQDLDGAKRGDRGTCVPIEQQQRTRSADGSALPLAPQRSSSFSFDVWFCLLPNSDEPSILPGGIILGAQSVQWIHPMVWAHYHQQFLHVDTQYNLYCSVLGRPKEMVATSLQVERWYHVALSYDDEIQQVYLDGKLVHFDEGKLHREWARLEHVQIGTGCISGTSAGKPTPKFCGWYGFHGLVDEFRVWKHALSSGEVERLSRGLALATTNLPCYALKDDPEINYCGSVVEVKCSRPREKYVAMLHRLEGIAPSAATTAPSFWNFEWPLFMNTHRPKASPVAAVKSKDPRTARR